MSIDPKIALERKFISWMWESFCLQLWRAQPAVGVQQGVIDGHGKRQTNTQLRRHHQEEQLYPSKNIKRCSTRLPSQFWSCKCLLLTGQEFLLTNLLKWLKKQEMINKVGIQLYSDLVIFSMLVFIKSPCTSLGPGQSTSCVLAAPVWQE